MARFMFAMAVVLKLVMWAAMAFGVYLGIRALIDGDVFLGLLILIVLIPVGLGILAFGLGLVQMAIVMPVAAATGRWREMREFSSFQIAVAEEARADRLTLRQGKILLGMFQEIPPGPPGTPPRSGDELLRIYDELHADDELEADSLDPEDNA